MAEYEFRRLLNFRFKKAGGHGKQAIELIASRSCDNLKAIHSADIGVTALTT